MHAVVRPAVACLLLVGVGLAVAVLTLRSPRLVRAAVPVAAAPQAPSLVTASVTVLEAAPKTSPPG
jgi:hypothetical protein